ncbi:hypothetical protein C3495_06200 [Clostridiaceae bacterium 14S0207]|nr:hypothetical protein C3495_06200 [Clostridiaceae bacterium 14S0207]
MLNELLKSEIAEIETVERESFKVTDLESANWCFRKISALQNNIESNKSLAVAEKLRIDKWEKKVTEEDKETIQYFESLITEYYLANRELDKKFKLSTPYGKVSSRKSKKYNWTDEEELLKYLKENKNDELIRVKEEINKTEFKKVYKNGVNQETGEIIPGVDVREEESISIKVE